MRTVNKTKEPIAVRLPLDVVKTLRKVRAEHGVLVTMQIELALMAWWRRKGYTKDPKKKTARRRAGTRRQA